MCLSHIRCSPGDLAKTSLHTHMLKQTCTVTEHVSITTNRYSHGSI